MRNEEDDDLKRFRESYLREKGHFHILEQRVPLELQMRYFKYAERLRKANDPPRPLSEVQCEAIYGELLDKGDKTLDEKRYLLTQLGTSRSVRAYRLIQEYARNPEEELRDWAYMAQMDARIALESDLSEERQIYISSGLGGKEDKLRFYVLLFSKDYKPFLAYQRQTIEREFAYYLPKSDCEIERLSVGEQYMELVALFPIRADIRVVLEKVIDECNQYGDFLDKFISITNVRELTQEEIAEIIKHKDGNGKASD